MIGIMLMVLVMTTGVGAAFGPVLRKLELCGDAINV
jgi:hypothetical protein